MTQKELTTEAPFFSVVIPTYNREDLILETLESVFQQNYTNYEIVVVDNASVDNTIDLLRPLEAEGKIRIIQNEKNVERAKARNIGFKAPKGGFLTLLGSDDFMYPNNLKDAADFVVKNKEFHFFHNYYELVDNQRKALYHYRFPSSKKHVKALAEGNFISCIGVFLSKEVYQKYLFNEDEKILGSEDWELWIRIMAEYPLGVIPQINNGIRSHANRSISAYDLDSILSRKEYIIDGLMKQERVKAVFGGLEGLMRASACVFAAVSANQAKQFDKAKEFLRKALIYHRKLLINPRFLRVVQIANFRIDKSFT